MKRLFDIIFAGTCLVIFMPLMIVVAFLVYIKLGFPVLFFQERPGLFSKPFVMIKFRSMISDTGADHSPLPDSERLTRFGLWLRSTSLDELPSLYSVLKGDMSFVGPRPLLTEYLALYSLRQSRRHDVRPGLTGWAQINGRNSICWERKLELDIWYVENRSFWLDLKILFITISKVLGREGITGNGEVTMSKFEGKNNNKGDRF